MSFIEGLPIMPNGSKAILQVMPIDIMYIIFDELALSDGSLDIKTLLLVLPYPRGTFYFLAAFWSMKLPTSPHIFRDPLSEDGQRHLIPPLPDKAYKCDRPLW
ncbi:hypothetical protein N7475_005823 [Penicillium sp. IBT 31633x]|nr:hypothetical protein N7475_005823 [Penicillium sp. IBT 31633x]